MRTNVQNILQNATKCRKTVQTAEVFFLQALLVSTSKQLEEETGHPLSQVRNVTIKMMRNVTIKMMVTRTITIKMMMKITIKILIKITTTMMRDKRKAETKAQLTVHLPSYKCYR